jgi:hypothetical protein
MKEASGYGYGGVWYGSGEREEEVGRTVRAGAGAAVGVVTELVDVETALSIGIVALNVVGDGGGAGLRALLESHGAGDLGVTTEDGNCRVGMLAKLKGWKYEARHRLMDRS